MAWNPSPKVAAARDFARKFGKQMVVIISLSAEGIESATYGETKALCSEAKEIGDVAYDAVMGHFTD